MPIEIAPAASDAERLAALAVRAAAYAPDQPALAYQAGRLAWRRQARAQPWVLRSEGAVASTLMCYPAAFSIDGCPVAGYALGSVATAPAERGRGHASALCRAVCEAEEQAGRSVGLLFSAIDTAFYERLGFRALPAPAFRATDLSGLAASGPALDLVPVDPRREAAPLSRLYEAAHRGSAHIARTPALFLENVEDAGDDWFLLLPAGRGYLRVSAGPEVVEVLEVALLGASDEAPALRALARLALDLKRTGLAGWLPATPFVTRWFAPVDRASQTPMVRGDGTSASWRIWATDYV